MSAEMPRVLVLAATTGYQTRSFGEAAERLGLELVFATDRCHLIEDPWQDHAIPIRFHDEDASVAAIIDAANVRRLDGVLAVGDRPTVIAARVAQGLGLAGHPPGAAAVARHKQRTREHLRDAGLPVPWFFPVAISHPASAPSQGEGASARLADQPLSYPCVVKPVALSGSRGVMRADDAASFAAAFERLRVLLGSPEVRAERNDAHETALVEGFIPGCEYAIEALLHHGVLHVLAIFDKPVPLDGPFFEETIYVTPSSAPVDVQDRIVQAVASAAKAIGLHHGPIHAECRVDSGQGASIFVLEVAARPIGGLCARALRFAATHDPQSATRNPQSAISLEELLLRHALGEAPGLWRRESDASGVMMIPIPRRGILRGVDGLDAARLVPGIDGITITAKPDQRLVPLPEGASYLGFIFARAPRADAVVHALAEAHARLTFVVDAELPLLTSAQMHYNLLHG
jgi:D-alanine-D-alanine ligase-like ATP-grasp enzyme